MGCNCKGKVALETGKFGTCALCMYATLAGFICSWLLLGSLLYIGVPRGMTISLSVPAVFFSIWLALHLIRSLYLGQLSRRSPMADPRT